MTEFDVEVYNRNEPLKHIIFRAIVKDNRAAGEVRENITYSALHWYYSKGFIPETGIDTFLNPQSLFNHTIRVDIAAATAWNTSDLVIYRIEEVRPKKGRPPETIEVFKLSEKDFTVISETGQ